VVGVGGTTLNFASGQFSSETVWYNGIVNGTPYGTGGGISLFESEPLFQSTYGLSNANGRRCVPDVSFDADPNSGVSVYSSPYSNGTNWHEIGGTSLGAPCWAAIYSIDLTASNSNLYNDAEIAQVNQNRFRDITSGNNGVYNATQGYDKVTGLGSPLTTTYNVPEFAMKTLTDGLFYNPNQTVSYVKAEEWFTNDRAVADQTGNTTTGYPFRFPVGLVGLNDLVTLATSYGFSEGGYLNAYRLWNYQADIKPDRKVDLGDLVILATHYGNHSQSWYNTDISHISINFTVTGNPQPVTRGLDNNGFVAIPANCTDWMVFRNDTNTAVGAFLTFWG
jgi:hypothetical protein